MLIVSERLATAQWVLERQLSWIATADVKAGAVVAIDIGMLSALAAAFGSSAAIARTSWAYLFCLIATGAVVIAVFCTAMSLLPRVSGPTASLLFFGRIAEVTSGEYKANFTTVSDADLLEDWADQIHRNAQIACDKHAWVRKGLLWSFFSAAPWTAAIALLVKI